MNDDDTCIMVVVVVTWCFLVMVVVVKWIWCVNADVGSSDSMFHKKINQPSISEEKKGERYGKGSDELEEWK